MVDRIKAEIRAEVAEELAGMRAAVMRLTADLDARERVQAARAEKARAKVEARARVEREKAEARERKEKAEREARERTNGNSKRETLAEYVERMKRESRSDPFNSRPFGGFIYDFTYTNPFGGSPFVNAGPNARSNGPVPPCFAALGLTLPTTVEAVKAKYRELAKTAHPDRGGQQSEFIKIQKAYEDCLAYLERNGVKS